jgi:CBS domain-containing protein
VVVLLLTSRRLTSLHDGALPALERWLREGGQGGSLADARTPAEVRALPGLLDIVLEDFLRVESALTPVTYRVYPDTPLGEVVDLMARRQLHAVPVVGEGYEVMGIITSSDALRDLLPRRRSSEGEAEGHEAEGLTARDVMTRTVMCVSEEQPLLDAAVLMVNRDVEQLPVVREGELVGFLTRDAVLRALFGR